MKLLNSNLKFIGIFLLSSATLFSSLTSHKYYYLFILPVIIGIIFIGMDYNKQGKLKSFIWMNAAFIFIFALLIYLTLNNIF